MTPSPLNLQGTLLFIVDDDADTRQNLRDILELDGYAIAEAGSARELFALPDVGKAALILLDRKLPDGDAEKILPRIKKESPQASVIVVTGHADIAGAVSALRQGAADYIVKPVNPDALRASIRRELEHQRSERQLRALFENGLDGFIIFNAEEIIVDANPAACAILGLERAQLCGKVLRHLLAPAVETPGVNMHSFFAEENRAGECRLRHGTGIAIDVEHRTTFNFSPGLNAISLRDVTERKRAEQRALQAERLAAIGETMTALVHESRNALQRSYACLEMLALEVEDRPEAMDLVARTQRAQDQLRHLYEEVRQWAAPVNVCRQKTDLSVVWREAWQHVIQVNRKGVALQENLECTPFCLADRSMLGQVFRNIFENAVEVSSDQGVVELHCLNGEGTGKDELRITIRDAGPGLSAEQQARMFEPFYTTKSKGTGLGMAIAQRIIHAHQGQIAASSPHGAQIELTLPKAPP
jgi:PAS domain S-box-containing protein